MAIKQLSLNYSLNTGSKWIYCNFPEKLPTDAYGDKNAGSHCLNRQTVSGTGQIFYSYNCQKLSGTCNFGIRVYNPGTSSVTFTRTNYGHSNSKEAGGWDPVGFKSWQRFFQSTSKSFTIPAKGSVWICEEALPENVIFSGNLRFTASASVVIAVYIYKSKANIADSTSIYPYNKNNSETASQYSGYGNGYYLTASGITIKLSDILNSGGVYFTTNSRNNTNFTVNNSSTMDEIIPIHIAGTSYVAKVSEKVPLRNLANWSAQYYFPITFINDLDTKAHTVRCQICSPDVNKKLPIVNCGGTISSAVIESATKPWEWKTVSVKDKLTLNYQFILGTNSYAEIRHMFVM
jgi:hypothetical protein